jgi:putative NADPH-quinone reductase
VKTRIYAIVAHDRKDSLTQFIFKNIVDSLKQQGAEIDVLDLYDNSSRIPFYVSDKSQLDSNEFFQENRERFMAANRLLIVYPVYWFAVPGILKTWIDLVTHYAWKYEGGMAARPLHSIDKLYGIALSLAPSWYLKWVVGDLSCRQVKASFKWMGVKKFAFYHAGEIDQNTNREQGDKYVREAIKKSSFLL